MSGITIFVPYNASSSAKTQITKSTLRSLPCYRLHLLKQRREAVAIVLIEGILRAFDIKMDMVLIGEITKNPRKGGITMSTSLMYHAFGLSDYDYVHQKFANGIIIFRVRPKWRLVRCPTCHSRQVIRRGLCMRRLRTVPIGFKPVCLEIEIPRTYCPKMYQADKSRDCEEAQKLYPRF